MEEIWKPIKGYEGVYAISNHGRIYSYPREGTKGGFTFGNNVGNYLGFTINKKTKYVHILVYETFVGTIPKGYQINHKDENKHNNCVWNLETITPSQNVNYGKRNEKDAEHKIKPIEQYTVNGEFVYEYKGSRDAERKTGISQSNICKCCKGKVKTAGGYVWKYKE